MTQGGFCGTLGYALVLPVRKSGFRAGFRPGSSRESFKIGRRADFEASPIRVRPRSGLEAGVPVRKHVLRNIEYQRDSRMSAVLFFWWCLQLLAGDTALEVRLKLR